jgi:hypothetical protein
MAGRQGIGEKTYPSSNAGADDPAHFAFRLIRRKFPVCLFVESDDESAADACRGCSQVPRRAHHVGKQRFIVGSLVEQIEVNHFLSFDRHQAIHVIEQLQCLFPPVSDSRRLNGRSNAPTDSLKEPLSFFARHSGAPIVQPIDLNGHETSSLVLEVYSGSLN